MAGPVHSDGCNLLSIVFVRRCEVIPACCCGSGTQLSVCVDIAASLLPTLAAAASSTLPTLRRHNLSAAAVQTTLVGELARGGRQPLSTSANEGLFVTPEVFTVDVAITQDLLSVDTSPHMSPRAEEGEVSEADEELLCKPVCVDLPAWYLTQVAQTPRH